QHRIFGEHPVDTAAERAGVGVGSRLAAGPTLKEITGNAVPGFYARDPGANFDDFAGAIRQRDDLLAHRHAVAAADDAEIAEIERAGAHLDQHLTMAGLCRIRPLDPRQRFDPGAALRQFISFHGVLSLSASQRCPVLPGFAMHCPKNATRSPWLSTTAKSSGQPRLLASATAGQPGCGEYTQLHRLSSLDLRRDRWPQPQS